MGVWVGKGLGIGASGVDLGLEMRICCKRFLIWDWFGRFDMWISMWITFGGSGFLGGKGWGILGVDKVVDKVVRVDPLLSGECWFLSQCLNKLPSRKALQPLCHNGFKPPP